MRDRSKRRRCPNPACIQALLKRSSCIAAVMAQGDVGICGVTSSHPMLQGSSWWVSSADDDGDVYMKAVFLDALSLDILAI